MDTFTDDAIPEWRRPAPIARSIAVVLFGWSRPALVFLACIATLTPLILFAGLAPFFLSLSSTIELIGPIADARAASAGVKSASATAPFYQFLLTLAERFAPTPGRIYLVAKAIAAILAAFPLAYFVAVRFPMVKAIAICIAVTAVIVAPFSGPSEIALAYFVVLAVGLLCPPTDESRNRAAFEGGLTAGLLFALWMLSPAFLVAGLLALLACTFLTGGNGLTRFASAFLSFVVIALLAELTSPGINVARTAALTGKLNGGLSGDSIMTTELAGGAISALVVLFTAVVFGGREHVKAWLVSGFFALGGVIACGYAGANPALVFIAAAGMAVFSMASPFYDGVFRVHDRASIAAAVAVATLSLFWTGLVAVQVIGQLHLQRQISASSDTLLSRDYAIVHAQGQRTMEIANGIGAAGVMLKRVQEMPAQEGHTDALREVLARLRRLTNDGVSVALLTRADTACVLVAVRRCRSNGWDAANDANVVFVPRIDLEKGAKEIRAQSEALLYTDFTLAERMLFWDVWVRRDIAIAPEAITFGRGL